MCCQTHLLLLFQYGLEHRQRVSGSLSGTSTSLCDNVTPLEGQGDSLLLDSGGCLEALACNGLEESGFEVEVGKAGLLLVGLGHLDAGGVVLVKLPLHGG